MYDITGLLGEHPGGEEPLVEEAAGRDSTESYEVELYIIAHH